MRNSLELDHRDEPGCDFTMDFIAFRRLEVRQLFREVFDRFFGAVVINNHVAGNAIHPALQLLIVPQGLQAFVHFEEDVLQDVFSERWIVDATANKTQELIRISAPKGFDGLHRILFGEMG